MYTNKTKIKILKKILEIQNNEIINCRKQIIIKNIDSDTIIEYLFMLKDDGLIGGIKSSTHTDGSDFLNPKITNYGYEFLETNSLKIKTTKFIIKFWWIIIPIILTALFSMIINL